MFRKINVPIIFEPYCVEVVNDLTEEDFRYFDKDGFELNVAEQKFYKAMKFPIHHPILNHTCWQEPWYEVEDPSSNLFLDHSMILHRCAYRDDARDQIEELTNTYPQAQFLLQMQPKWGYDFDLNAIRDNGELFEVLHVEIDDRNYGRFVEAKNKFEEIVEITDWNDVANQIWNNRQEWQCLSGFDQNDWKANYILGWKKSEFLQKAY